MKIRNVTSAEIESALQKTNERFEDNIIFNRFDYVGKNFQVTLKVKSAKGAGARVGFIGRAMISACWHVYGTFIEELFIVNPSCVIVSMGNKIDINGGNWVDKNIGSQINPLMYSDACHCYEVI
jgi:hypothetical protein